MTLRAVLFDVDFTLVKPGPDRARGLPAPRPALRARARPGAACRGPRRGGRGGRAASGAGSRRGGLGAVHGADHPWDGRRLGARLRGAVEMTRAWEHAENFELYEDTLPVLATLREHGLKIGLVSNTGRDLDAFVAHHALDVDAAVGSGAHGKTKPHPAIFLRGARRLDVGARRRRWSGTRRRTTSPGPGRSGCGRSSSTGRAASPGGRPATGPVALPAALGLTTG